jgi:hypothetical protein
LCEPESAASCLSSFYLDGNGKPADFPGSPRKRIHYVERMQDNWG